MRPSERRDVRQELRGSAESVALALHDSMAEVKRLPANDDGAKEVQAGYAEMLVLQCHLALSRNRPECCLSWRPIYRIQVIVGSIVSLRGSPGESSKTLLCRR